MFIIITFSKKNQTKKQTKKQPQTEPKSNIVPCNIQNVILMYCKQSSYLYPTRFSNITYELADCHKLTQSLFKAKINRPYNSSCEKKIEGIYLSSHVSSRCR